MLQPFTIRRLKMGAFVLEGDNNFPHRAELAGHFDIDGDKGKIAEAVGLGPGMIMIDAGAFIGDTAHIFSSYGCEVIGFEPFLDAAVCAWLNTRGIPNVRILNLATGNGEKVELVFECPGPNFGMRSVRVSDGPNAIASTRIDELELARLDFLKVDVEGREIETLLGARETIKRCKPILFVEMYEDGLKRQGHTPAELEECIRSLGYDLQMWGAPPRWDWLCRPAAATPAVNLTPPPEYPGEAAEYRLREDAPPAVVAAAVKRAGGMPEGTPVDPATIPAQPPIDNDHVAPGAEKFAEAGAHVVDKEMEAEAERVLGDLPKKDKPPEVSVD
jgi:FkbM family methyltransferase